MGMVRQIAIYLDNDTVLKKAGYRNSGDHIKRGSAAKNKKSARRDSNQRVLKKASKIKEESTLSSLCLQTVFNIKSYPYPNKLFTRYLIICQFIF